MTESQPNDSASSWTLWGGLAILGIIGLVVVLVSASLEPLMGKGAWAIRGALHGTTASLFMVTATIGLFQAYRIAAGKAWNVVELQLGSVLNAAMAGLTVLSGNWIYIPYRAPEGPRSYFLSASPEIHKVFFEFKEFAALFTFPLAVTAAYLLLRYGGDLYRRRGLSTIVAVLLVLVFFYFIVAFGLGAAITKLQSV